MSTRNPLLSWIAIEPNTGERAKIGASLLYHRSPAQCRNLICGTQTLANPPQVRRVHLRAETGWQLSFWKFIRDLTVFDTELAVNDTHGRYLYFFVGEPSPFTIRANAGATHAATAVDRYTLKGSDVLAAGRVFYRPVDKVIALRGAYSGPASVQPE